MHEEDTVSFEGHSDELQELLKMFSHSSVTSEVDFLKLVVPDRIMDCFHRAVAAVQHCVIVTHSADFLPMHNNNWTLEIRQTGGDYKLMKKSGSECRWNDNGGELREFEDTSEEDMEKYFNGTLFTT